MSGRLDWIDISRGIFFFPMLIYHLFSIYDTTTGTIYSQKPVIHFLGNVRLLYIILAGISLYLATIKPQPIGTFLKKRWNRSYHIAFYAAALTILTYFLYPSSMIHFGILHFIALATLLVSPIAYANSIPLTSVCFIISLWLSYGNLVPSISKPIDVVTGGSVPYNSMDWFPLKRYLPYLLFGLLFAQLVGLGEHDEHDKHKNEEDKETPYRQLEWMGKNSLELYAAHVIVLLVVYYVLFRQPNN
jgi:uncharacterized membrane protein